MIREFIELSEITGRNGIDADTDMSRIEALSIEIEKFEKEEAEMLHWFDTASLDGG